MLDEQKALAGFEMERLLGHAVSLLMLRREGLCMFSAVYRFVQDSYEKRQPMWASCCVELEWLWALMPLLVADTRRPGL